MGVDFSGAVRRTPGFQWSSAESVGDLESREYLAKWRTPPGCVPHRHGASTMTVKMISSSRENVTFMRSPGNCSRC